MEDTDQNANGGEEFDLEAAIKEEKIEKVEGCASVNALIDQVQGIQKQWLGLFKPVAKAKAATLKSAGLNKTPGSSLKHVALGLPIYIAASIENITLEELQKKVVIDLDNKKGAI